VETLIAVLKRPTDEVPYDQKYNLIKYFVKRSLVLLLLISANRSFPTLKKEPIKLNNCWGELLRCEEEDDAVSSVPDVSDPLPEGPIKWSGVVSRAIITRFTWFDNATF
jgi:hypothetical protein